MVDLAAEAAAVDQVDLAVVVAVVDTAVKEELVDKVDIMVVKV